MEAPAATTEAPARDPHLPPLQKVGDLISPKAPANIAGARLDEGALTDLAIRLAYTANRFTADWIAKRLHLSLPLVEEILEHLGRDGLIEETMASSANRALYRITERGRLQGARSMEVCTYIGPAPVSLEAYSAMLRWQFANTPQVKPENVTAALSNLVLPDQAKELAGLAVSSGRSLFVYGPSGNGKTSLGRAAHAALVGDCWIPYCLIVRDSIIRLFDEQVHKRVEIPPEKAAGIDQRWVRIRRPLVVVGGELTLDFLDLIYSPSLRYYESPPHLKANGGVFLVDDFGRERISPDQLLNRFIVPMEHQLDYFTLATGQKIQVPLRHVLIICTNLDPEKVTDPAFLRRMGYRLSLDAPSPEQYGEIFRAYAKRYDIVPTGELLENLLARYRENKRELRACEPRDLVERARDICRFRGTSLELTPEVMNLAWLGYFGRSTTPQPANDSAGAPAAKA
jgi:predicted ATPase with chaperone activity